MCVYSIWFFNRPCSHLNCYARPGPTLCPGLGTKDLLLALSFKPNQCRALPHTSIPAAGLCVGVCVCVCVRLGWLKSMALAAKFSMNLQFQYLHADSGHHKFKPTPNSHASRGRFSTAISTSSWTHINRFVEQM